MAVEVEDFRGRKWLGANSRGVLLFSVLLNTDFLGDSKVPKLYTSEVAFAIKQDKQVPWFDVTVELGGPVRWMQLICGGDVK